NFSAACDENGEYSDCIELYNPGNLEVSLDGYFLTDDKKALKKYSLEGIRIPAKGYAAVWLNKESGLRISKNGDEIFLTDTLHGVYLDQLVVPSLPYNTSYGRITGSDEWSVMSPTLGRSNDEGKLIPTVSLKEPVFEYTSGFYEEAFSLRLYSPTGEKIYYTLDGSEPCIDSFVYEKPLLIADNSQEENNYAARKDLAPSKDYTPDFPVDKAVVVRAACYDPLTNQISKTVTETFFVGYHLKSEYNNMAVVSLTADPKDLFDKKTGIYGNGEKYEAYLKDGIEDGRVLDKYTDENGVIQYRYMASNAFNEGKAWERKASISYFDETHSHIFTQDIGIRISGNSTRSAPQKSINIFARDIYDDSEILPYAFFDHADCYSTIKLRNGGGNNDQIKFLDAFLEKAAEEREISIQASKPCVVFLNGEYWGIYNIRERYDEEYLSARYGLEPESVMMIKAGNAVTSPEETIAAYQYMLSVITECDLIYDDTYALAGELVDIQSLIDYCCINLYLDNRDVAFGYNTALWRTTQEGTPYSDGKWRYMLYDLDECIFPDSNVRENRDDWMAEHPLMMEPAVLSLLDNESFRRQFCISFMDIANTTFSYERMHSMLAEWSSLYNIQTVKDHQRFYDSLYGLETYQQEVSCIDDFFRIRFKFAMESLAKTFHLQGELKRIRISSNIPSGGVLNINTATLEDGSAWEGYYYSDFPITVKAKPNKGYHFVSWQGDVSDENDSITVSLDEGEVSIQAVFEKDQ
ncbi:MAG: CotH kinase family protein, partial [Lachnospiraceae bacterium]|nr:CotH kinase family protein [Lachnospiraceae bacterium]